MKKKILFFLGVILIGILCSSCAMRTVDEMYSLPRRSLQNISLRNAVESAMAEMTYAAPLSGENQEPVQTADLDGNGQDEYLLFAKESKSDSLQILIFRQLDPEHYELWDSIPCKGTAFDQIWYASIDDKDGIELIVGTRISEKVTRTASIYAFSSGQAEKIKSVIYQKGLICDLNEDGRSELLVIQNGEAETEGGSVRLYSYVDGDVQSSEEAKMTVGADQIRKIAVNKLSSGEPAIYVASSCSEKEILTDIFAIRSGVFSNITQSSPSGTSMQTMRNNFVYAEDIDSDGILELPGQITMAYNTTEQNMLRWYSLDIDGNQVNKKFTFHNFLDGWYFDLDSEWIDRFAAEKDGNVYTFYMWNNSNGSAVPVFTVYTLTGRDRDIQATAQNRFVLYRGEDVVFSGKLESASTVYGVTESYLESAFHLIRQDWKTAES